MQVNNGQPISGGSDMSKLHLMAVLEERCEDIQQALKQSDWTAVAEILSVAKQNNDQTIYQEVGRLTRALHDAIRNFHVEDQLDTINSDRLSDLSDAKDRLSYVVEMTEKAANRTMDLVDECVPIASDSREELTHLMQDWQRLVDRELSAEEFRALYWRVDHFFKSQDANYELLQSHFTEILLAQDYQDLTGQVIYRVTSLVRDVESSLLKLVTMASHVDQMTGQLEHSVEQTKDDSIDHKIKAEGPQIKVDQTVVTNQDDVDDLLSSLGF